MCFEPCASALMHQSFQLSDQMKRASARNKFLKAEDDLLRTLVSKYGDTNWCLISSFMSRRNARQCRERYKNYLSPAFHNNPWTPAEEELLSQKVLEIGPKWSVIARMFQGRSDVSVKNHWAAMASRNERIEKYSHAKDNGAADEWKGDPFGEDWAEWTISTTDRIVGDTEDREYLARFE
jgi:hypothetical protein